MVLICNSQVVCVGKLNGLYIACYNIRDREWLVYLSRWSIYESGRLDKFHCSCIGVIFCTLLCKLMLNILKLEYKVTIHINSILLVVSSSRRLPSILLTVAPVTLVKHPSKELVADITCGWFVIGKHDKVFLIISGIRRSCVITVNIIN